LKEKLSFELLTVPNNDFASCAVNNKCIHIGAAYLHMGNKDKGQKEKARY
jgi:hypothetical protein